jgi:hypothetical protein
MIGRLRTARNPARSEKTLQSIFGVTKVVTSLTNQKGGTMLLSSITKALFMDGEVRDQDAFPPRVSR